MLLAASLLGLVNPPAQAANFTIDLDAPTIDKWVYPFGGDGNRANAPIFGAVGTDGFDNRDGQMYAGFDTALLVPAGLGASSYLIFSATFTLSMAPGASGSAPAVIFDGTYDPYKTYGANPQPDDPGRSIELFGVGYRGGLSNLTVINSTDVGGFGTAARPMYPTDFVGGTSLSGNQHDVANNVSGQFEAVPFAVGQVAAGDLQGGMIKEDADIVFTLNLLNPDVLRYLQLSLNEGRIAFIASSLHEASQTGPVVYPVFYTNENLLGGLPGRLDLQVVTVPEPNVAGLLGMGLAGLAGLRRRRTGGPARAPRMRTCSASTGGFTLLELLVVVAIIGVLTAIILPSVRSSIRMGGLAREVSASRQIMGAYAAYSAENDGDLLPGYLDAPAFDETGAALHNPVSARYPWRLAPYLQYEMRLFWGNDVNDKLSKIVKSSREEYNYAVSVMPALGMNVLYVGGDYQTLPPNKDKAVGLYGRFCATKMAHVDDPTRLIVFASAGGGYQGQTMSGYFRVDAPNTTTSNWSLSSGKVDMPDNFGHVHFRWDGKAVAVMLDGHTEMLTPAQMVDMRRWSIQAAAADEPGWKLGKTR